ncbi:HAD family phosphatase [Dysgonomonas sp. 37-18]|uniref:HAD family hydrolase n=1 Tax=Dysgonomonas sp. 37-18 TaxID=1895907 RepID=UPI0025C2966A|nr:HAD family phosphatase [Dysgonomonas sp. 37-18]
MFEESVQFSDVLGAIDFVKELKLHNIRVGLVTSVTELKLNRACQQMQFDTLFDVIISPKDIQNGRPASDCFLLGVKRLSCETRNCIVFEDSLAGITAGNAAGMSVIGLATTHTEEILMDKCIIVISDFRQITVNWLKTIISNI